MANNTATAPIARRGRWIENWDPEDVVAWDNGGAKIARRNLIWSVVAEHVGFSVWSIWSVMVLFMPQNVYHIDAAGKFFLVAMPTLVGAVLRLPYTSPPHGSAAVTGPSSAPWCWRCRPR
ncbi:Probable integral membrane nitrite extrusion protein NarK3 [Mycobacteroides abscessus]|nr:Probable integral membrane nitrite extrusion protein NarK3 [Mycobacteroides abscessus]